MKGSMVREKLKSGDRVYGTHIASMGTPVEAQMTAQLELDFIFICTEHIPVDRTEVSNMCQFYSARGISPMVRIPCVSANWAGMYLDGGAEGIVAPYVETVEEVKELVGAVKYRPIKGRFLREILNEKREPKEKTRRFLERFNSESYLIIGVESVEAINNLEELISVEGVDGVFLGPHDITCSMEIPEEYDNPEFTKTVVDVIKRCRNKGVGVGIHGDLTSEICKPFLEAGANFMLNLADIVKMKQKLAEDLTSLRGKFNDRYERNAGESSGIDSCIEPQ